MHILLIHQAFATRDEPGGTRHYELCRHLAEEGHRVTVVASTLNYHTGAPAPKSDDHGGTQGVPHGITIRHAWTSSLRRGGFLGRLANFVSFMLSSLISGLGVRNVGVVWGTSPSIFQAVTAYTLARLKRVPYVLEIRDLWPDFAIQTGVLQNRLLIWASRRMERFLYHRSNCIIVNSPGFIPHLEASGVNRDKIELVPNGVDTRVFDGQGADAVREEFGLEGKFLVMYAGSHGLANDLDTVLESANLLREHQDIVFVLVGDGKKRRALIDRATAMNLDNLHFIPAQPKARTPAFLAAADVCVAILQAVPMFDTTYPNKVFDYMAAGRPTLLAIDGVIRQVIEEAAGGTFVPPGDPAALANAVRTYYRDVDLRRQQGENAWRYVRKHFDYRQHATKLAKLLEQLETNIAS